MSDPPVGLVAALGVAVFEPRGERRLRLVGPPPGWLRGLHGGLEDGVELDADALSDFLASFLPDAEDAWRADEVVRSGPFEEAGEDRVDRVLEATALAVDGRSLLLLSDRTGIRAQLVGPLQAAREQALALRAQRKAAEQREVVAHCLVHDLKGPLAGMLGALSLIELDDLPEETLEMVRLARGAAERQRAMVEEILAAYSAESAALDSGRAPVVTVLREAEGAAQAAAEALGLRLRLRLDPAADGAEVAAHPADLRRVLDNLLDNAMRHSPEGAEVVVGLAAHAGRLRLAVEDAGSGVPEADRERIFERFTRGAGRGGSAGLGLYYCRLVAERAGGAIRCEASPSGGAAFVLDLPRL